MLNETFKYHLKKISLLILFVFSIKFLLIDVDAYYNRVQELFDAAIKYESRNVSVQDTKKISPDIFFFDIDTATFKRWNLSQDSITPREKLAQLIKIATDNKAKLIIVDILLEKTDNTPPNNNRPISGKQGDKILKETLEEIKNTKSTKIILLNTSFDGKTLSPIIADSLIDHQFIFQAVQLFNVKKHDFKIRHFISYKNYLYKDKPEDFWTIPQLAAILFKEDNPDFDQIKQTIPAEQNNRIRYFMQPDKLDEDRKIPAYKLLDSNINLSRLNGKVVFIGNSAYNFYLTPSTMNNMPEVYIQANALNTLLTNNQTKVPTIWFENFLILILILLFYFWQNFYKNKHYFDIANIIIGCAVVPVTWGIYMKTNYMNTSIMILPILSVLFSVIHILSKLFKALGKET